MDLFKSWISLKKFRLLKIHTQKNRNKLLSGRVVKSDYHKTNPNSTQTSPTIGALHNYFWINLEYKLINLQFIVLWLKVVYELRRRRRRRRLKPRISYKEKMVGLVNCPSFWIQCNFSIRCDWEWFMNIYVTLWKIHEYYRIDTIPWCLSVFLSSIITHAW